MNWREQNEVNVGWAGKPEMGMMRCEVVEYHANKPGSSPEPHAVKSVRWAKGKVNRVAYCHSESRYVWEVR